jgi:hypothetical protein
MFQCFRSILNGFIHSFRERFPIPQYTITFDQTPSIRELANPEQIYIDTIYEWSISVLNSENHRMKIVRGNIRMFEMPNNTMNSSITTFSMGPDTYEFIDGIIRKMPNPEDIISQISQMSLNPRISSEKRYKIQLDSCWKEYEQYEQQQQEQTFYDEMWYNQASYKNLLDVIREYQLFFI